MSLAPVLARIDADLNKSIERLSDLLRIPSISTDPIYAKDCQKAADWLVADLTSLGAEISKRQTPGHPIVLGHITPPDSDQKPHLLFYGHYDVQPVDPLELWDRYPFDPAIEEANKGKVIRARGACDDKGQLMTFIEACRAWIAEHGDLPCKITFFFEGEEESGSPNLIPFMKGNKDEIKADIALICDTSLFDNRIPAITTMLRGLLEEEITITGPNKDLHSGLYGGASMNPIRVLTRILASLHDENGRITIPGFYDGVPELSDTLKQQWAALGFDHHAFLDGVGLSALAGERGYSALEMLWSQPTCEINGITGGYTGDGFKTVLPSQASAKISFRLVGHQNPEAIRRNLRDMIKGILPLDCSVSYKSHGSSGGVVMPTEAPEFEAARQALSDEWPDEAAFIGSGGSIPIAGFFQEITGVDPILIGFGKDDDQLHSPNEKYDVESFHKGMRSWARVLDALSGLER